MNALKKEILVVGDISANSIKELAVALSAAGIPEDTPMRCFSQFHFGQMLATGFKNRVCAIVLTRDYCEQPPDEYESAIRVFSDLRWCRFFLLPENDVRKLDNNRFASFIQQDTDTSMEQVATSIARFFEDAQTCMLMQPNRSMLFYHVIDTLYSLTGVLTVLLATDRFLTWGGIFSLHQILIVNGVWHALCFLCCFYLITFADHLARVFIGVYRNRHPLVRNQIIQLLQGGITCAVIVLWVTPSWSIDKALVVISCGCGIWMRKMYLYAFRVRVKNESISRLYNAFGSAATAVREYTTAKKENISWTEVPLHAKNNRKIFISYMHSCEWSRSIAERICAVLKSNEYEVFFDRTSIESGTNWNFALLDALGNSSRVVVVLDVAKTMTPWVLTESRHAAFLRHAIGHPGIILILRSLEKLTEAHPLKAIYNDIIGRKETCGASVIAAQEEGSFDQTILEAVKSTNPFGIF